MRDFFFEDPFFKSSWDNFDTVRERMFSENRDQWKKFDQDFRDMACMSNNIMLTSDNKSASSTSSGANTSTTSGGEGQSRELLQRQDSRSKWENGWMFPRRWMLPSLKNEFADMDLFTAGGRDSEVIRVKQDADKMEVSLDTAQYRPDELSVSVSDGTVTVEGKHEEKAEDGSKMGRASLSASTRFPPAPKPEEVVSNLSSDGVLVITAKKPAPAITNA